MSEDFLPTDEQAKIIGHNEGPALVFAVAGSGKTTTIVHRIARLCSEGKFAPSSILATCFNSSAAGNLRKDLAKLNVPAEFEVKEIERGKAVRVHTLNGLGSSILRHAAQLGLTSKYKLAEDIRNDIIHPAIQSAKRDPILSRCLQSMDTDDFLEYVSLCKANIQYPDLVSANLPEMAGKIATQATAPSDVRAKWYLDFYRYFEEERTKLELLTFDDQLLCAWDSLVRFPILLRDIRARHQCVIVDEFQDINYVQSEMLHLIVEQHRNYMAVGDDDQTIYEFRGASQKYIRDFQIRYNANKYYISENFRCPAAQVILAGAVIRENKFREPKSFNVTQGFRGRVIRDRCESSEHMASVIVNEIRHLLDNDKSHEEIVILIRARSQTPVIEAELLLLDIPYFIAGDVPFYKRPDNATLINHLRIGVLESKLLNGFELTPDELKKFQQLWKTVFNYTSRKLSLELRRKVETEVIRGKSIHKSVIDYASKSMRDQERKKLMDLAAILNFAANSDQRSAFDVLSGLLERLLLEEYFKAGAKTREDDAWKSKIESVKQFVRMSRGHNSVADFLEFIDRISFARGQDVPTEKRIRITTIHKAKGAQWAHVFIPDCDADQYPTPQSQNLEEDRRLLYVAITRSSETLHLMWTAPSPSPFLSVIGFEDILLDVDKFELFTRDRAAYDAHSSTVHSIARRLPLLSFIQKEWWEKSGRSRDIKKSILQALESSPRDSSTTSLNETYDNGNPIAAPSSEDSEEKRDSIASQVEKEVEGSIDLKSDISQTILCSKCGVQLEYILSTNLSGRAWTYSASFNCFLEAHGLSREQRRNLFCRGCHTPTLLPELATG